MKVPGSKLSIKIKLTDTTPLIERGPTLTNKTVMHNIDWARS
jgi:hypothetical protein